MIGIIAKQEIFKVFKNKKLLGSIFILPMVVLAAMFAMTSMGTEEETNACQIYFLNMQVAEQEFEAGGILLRTVSDSAESYEQFAKAHRISENDVIVEMMEDGFQIYYNSMGSQTEELLPAIKGNILKPYLEGAFLAEQGIVKENLEVEMEDTSSEMERKNKTVAFMLPYMMILVLFINSVSVVGDSIAGEKERGTLAKQLLTPIDNRQMILGRLMGTTVIGIISSAVFFVVLMGGSLAAEKFGGMDILGVSGTAIHAGQLGIMLFCFLFLAMAFVAAIALMSSFAQTVKEATSMSYVVYFLVMAAALATMFRIGETPKVAYLIPVYNFSVFMQNVLVGTADIVNGGITIASLFVSFGVLAVATILNFKRERVIC